MPKKFVDFNFLNKYKNLLTVLVAAVILFLAITRGLAAGSQSAEAQTEVQTAKNLAQGFGYFYSDQNRFPTAVEFSDSLVMSGYFNNFPPVGLVSGNCTENFIYKRISSSNFQLDFCLAAANSGYQAGWNVINQQNQ